MNQGHLGTYQASTGKWQWHSGDQKDKIGQLEQETKLIQNENYQLQIENFNYERNEGVDRNNTCKHCIEKFLITIEPKGTGKDILIIQNKPNGQFSDNGHHTMRFQLENLKFSYV